MEKKGKSVGKVPSGPVTAAPEKSKEDVKAEREAKKKAKQAAKSKGKSNVVPSASSAPTAEKKISPKVVPPVAALKEVAVTPISNQPAAAESKKPEEKTSDKEPKLSENKQGTELTKAEIKAARRLKQEAQRAAKENLLISKGAKPPVTPEVKQTAKVATETPTKPAAVIAPSKPAAVTTKPLTATKTPQYHRVKLFNHLYSEVNASKVDALLLKPSQLHPAVIALGLQYANKVIVGSNARCVALLNVLKQVISDYRTPANQEYARGLEARIRPGLDFLALCRPHSVSMNNAMRHVRRQMTLLKNNVSDQEATKKLHDAIDIYLREQIDVAAEAICLTMNQKISDGDVILVYGASSLLESVLVSAHANGASFRVLVVDARPWLEGRQLLRKLVERGISCSYVLVTAASAIMREATKVLLGAHALLANGCVMSRAGAAQVALLARAANVPVLVCCETHKFCEHVQTDAFVYNEIGNPDEVLPPGCLVKDWRSLPSLTPLNLTYDVTPPDLVTAVVTELTILPCTSVPVILRIKPSEADRDLRD